MLSMDKEGKFPLARSAIRTWPDRYRLALARGILGDLLSDGLEFPAVDAPTHVRAALAHLASASSELAELKP